MPLVTTYNQYGEPTTREVDEFGIPCLPEKGKEDKMLKAIQERYPSVTKKDLDAIEDLLPHTDGRAVSNGGIDKGAREYRRQEQTEKAAIEFHKYIDSPAYQILSDSAQESAYIEVEDKLRRKYPFAHWGQISTVNPKKKPWPHVAEVNPYEGFIVKETINVSPKIGEGIKIHQGNNNSTVLTGNIKPSGLDQITYGQHIAQDAAHQGDLSLKMQLHQNELAKELNTQAKSLSDLRKEMEAREKKDREEREAVQTVEDIKVATQCLDGVIHEVNASIVRWHLLRNKKMSMQDVISLIGSHLSRTLLEAGRKRSGVRKMVNGVIPREDRLFTKAGIREITQSIAWAGYGNYGLEGLTFAVTAGYEHRSSTPVVRGLMLAAQTTDFRKYYASREDIKNKMLADGTSPSAFHTDVISMPVRVELSPESTARNYSKVFGEKLAETTNTNDLCMDFSKIDSIKF